MCLPEKILIEKIASLTCYFVSESSYHITRDSTVVAGQVKKLTLFLLLMLGLMYQSLNFLGILIILETYKNYNGVLDQMPFLMMSL